MPRRSKTDEPQPDEHVRAEDVSLHDDEILISVTRGDEDQEAEAQEEEGALAPLVEAAPVSAAARHNARHPEE